MSGPLLRPFSLVALAFALLAAGSCSDDSPGGPSPPCAYSFVPASATFESAGGDRTVQVVTADACDWTVVSSVSWITLPGGNSSRGPASLAYRVAPNPGESARSGALRIGDTAFSITQSGVAPCVYDVTPAERVFEAAGGTGTVDVATLSHCPWTAVSSEPWVIITSGAEGAGTGTVTYSVARHEGNARRATSITVAGRTVVVAQEPAPVGPCDYSVSTADITLHWHQTGAQFTLTTDSHCTWTAAAAASWLDLTSPTEGAGSRLMTFANPIYTDESPRRGAIEVRWPTPTEGQNVWVTQEGCRYALGPSVVDIGANGATSQITVIASPASVDCREGCPWTAESTVPWIEILSSMPKFGDDLLVFRVQPNATSQARVGQVRIAHLSLTIRQAGQ